MKYTKIYYKYIKIYHKYIMSTCENSKILSNISKYIEIYYKC
jgi:hypothetical protein